MRHMTAHARKNKHVSNGALQAPPVRAWRKLPASLNGATKCQWDAFLCLWGAAPPLAQHCQRLGCAHQAHRCKKPTALALLFPKLDQFSFSFLASFLVPENGHVFEKQLQIFFADQLLRPISGLENETKSIQKLMENFGFHASF